MRSFYAFPEAARVAFSMASVICAGVAALVLVAHQYRFKRGFDYWLESAAAFLVLCQTVINAALVARVQNVIPEGYSVPSGYYLPRYAVFAAATAVAALIFARQLTWGSAPQPIGLFSRLARRSGRCGVPAKSQISWGGSEFALRTRRKSPPAASRRTAHTRSVSPLSTTCFFPSCAGVSGLKHSCEKALISLVGVAASFLTLPILEAWTGSAFPVFFSASLLVLLSGGAWLFVKIRGELETSISSLSVKQAVDSLDDAILFFRKNGHVLIQNNKMRELMLKTAGRVFYNGRLYLETVVAKNAEHCGAGRYLYRITAGAGLGAGAGLDVSEWLFTVRDVSIGRRIVTQLTAADVTELNRENLLLQEKHTELKQRQEQLKAFLLNIEETCREENLLRIKTAIHDAQNKKLTTLLQYLRYGQLPGGESFSDVRESLLRGILEPESSPLSPDAMLDVIIGQYGRKGVQIHLAGDLPPDREIALAFVHILQEASANAVAHGYANEVRAELAHEGNAEVLRVTDNSALPLKEFREGTGIKGMRRRAEMLGGSLEIFTVPQFTLTARIVTNALCGAQGVRI